MGGERRRGSCKRVPRSAINQDPTSWTFWKFAFFLDFLIYIFILDLTCLNFSPLHSCILNGFCWCYYFIPNLLLFGSAGRLQRLRSLFLIVNRLHSLICKKSLFGFCGPFITSLLDLFLTASDDLSNVTIFPLVSLPHNLPFGLAASSWLRSSVYSPWITNISKNYWLPNCNTKTKTPQIIFTYVCIMSPKGKLMS